MWGDRPYIQESIKAAIDDMGIESVIVEVSVEDEIVYLSLKSNEGVFLAKYRANVDGTATRMDG